MSLLLNEQCTESSAKYERKIILSCSLIDFIAKNLHPKQDEGVLSCHRSSALHISFPYLMILQNSEKANSYLQGKISAPEVIDSFPRTKRTFLLNQKNSHIFHKKGRISLFSLVLNKCTVMVLSRRLNRRSHSSILAQSQPRTAFKESRINQPNIFAASFHQRFLKTALFHERQRKGSPA